MKTQIPTDQWLLALEQLDQFSTLAPWQWMSDGQLFAIHSEVLDQWCYISIMGMAGEFRGIAVNVGTEGLRALEMLTQEELDSETRYAQCGIVVGYHPFQELEPETQQLFHTLKRKYRPTDWAPEVMSHKPGYMPWAPSLEELQAVTELFPAIMGVCEGVHLNPTMLGETLDLNELWALQKVDGEWKETSHKPDRSAFFRPKLPAWQKESVKMALSGLKIQPDIVLFEQFFLPFAVGEEDRPSYPKCLMLFDLQNQQIFGAELLPSHELIDQLPAVLPRMFRNLGFVPDNLIVSSKENFTLIRPFAHAAGIEIHLDEELKVKDELREFLIESMGGQ